VDLHDDITLDRRTLVIPPDTQAGPAQILLPDSDILAQFQVEALPSQVEVPNFAVPVDQPLGQVARLLGYTVGEVDLNAAAHVTLVWQAGDAPTETAYTVFVQLLNSEGRLIAQSDSQPAKGQRPTTGWRSGETIVDPHDLTFNDLAARGEATLIAGMYDPLTGQRIPVADGQDFLMLGTITIR
jgi:hypothetical protein